MSETDKSREAFEAWWESALEEHRRVPQSDARYWAIWAWKSSRTAALEEAAKVCDARAADNWGMTEAECEAQECSETIRAIARKEN